MSAWTIGLRVIFSLQGVKLRFHARLLSLLIATWTCDACFVEHWCSSAFGFLHCRFVRTPRQDILDIVLQASALDMHDVDARPRASLPTVAAALWAAARRPFDERLDGGRCLLVPSAALRLQVELAEHSALSPDASSFRAFAQMCAWLAHLVVTAKLSADVRAEVMQAFKKLAATCAELGRRPETAPNDPEGLCRLAMAVALVVREGEEKTGFGTDALDGLARICVEHAMDEAYEWRPQQLAVLASAFAAAEVPMLFPVSCLVLSSFRS